MSEGDPPENRRQSDLSYQHKCETREMLEKKCNLLALFMVKDIISKEIQSSKIKRVAFHKSRTP